TGDDLIERGADVLAAHDAGGERVMEIAEVSALLEIVDDDGRGAEERGCDLLFVLVVGTDGGDEDARRDVPDVEQRAPRRSSSDNDVARARGRRERRGNRHVGVAGGTCENAKLLGNSR